MNKWLIVVAIVTAGSFIYSARPRGGEFEEKQGVGEQCKKIFQEMHSKMQSIRGKCKNERKAKRQSFKESLIKNCWKEHRMEDVEAIRNCIVEKKQKILAEFDTMKNLVSQCFDERLAVLDSYKDKLKECVVKKKEFKEKKKSVIESD